MSALRGAILLPIESARDNATAEKWKCRAVVAHLSARPAFTRRGRRLRAAKVLKRSSTAVAVSAARYMSGNSKESLVAEVADSDPRLQCCSLLRLEGPDELQDLIASMVLSECVYKKLELDERGVAAKIAEYVSSFPPGWVELQAVQLSLPGIPQHYLVATSPTSMYVAFMGTKQFQDILADANLLHTPVWAEAARLAADRQSIPAAHRGFLERARSIHVEQLYELAVSRGLRLVLCGHSLGGAVAKLCTLRLLRELPDWPRPRVRCVAFATPAVGNAALAELVENAGWASHFASYYLPEDQLVRLISFSQARSNTPAAVGPGAPAAAAAAADGGVSGANRVIADRSERVPRRSALAAAALGGSSVGGGQDEGDGGYVGSGSVVASGDAAAAASPFTRAASAGPGWATLRSGVTLPGLARSPPVSASSVASLDSLASPGGSSGSSSPGSSREVITSGSAISESSAQLDMRSAHSGALPLCGRALSASAFAAAAVGTAPASPASSCRFPPPLRSVDPWTTTLEDEQTSATEMAVMEEILAPGPDEIEAAAAAPTGGADGVSRPAQLPADLAAAQREALYGGAGGGSWGLRLALVRRRAVRRMLRAAARARIPLPKALLPVARYHTFGEQWFVTEAGALTPEELERRQPREQDRGQKQPAAQQPAAQQQQQSKEPPEGARGFFSFHRMLAYRQRHLDIIHGLLHAPAGATPAALPAPHAAGISAVRGSAVSRPPSMRVGDSPAATPASSPNASALAPGAESGSADPWARVELHDSIIPRIVVHRAVLRGLLLDGSGAPPLANPSAVSAAAAAGVAAARASESTLAPSGSTRGSTSSASPGTGNSGRSGTPLASSSPLPGTASRRSPVWWTPRPAPSAPAPGVDARGRDSTSAAATALGGSPAHATRPDSVGATTANARSPSVTASTLPMSEASGGRAASRWLGWLPVGRGRGGAASSDTSGGFVRLDLELEGQSLQYCRKISVSLVRQQLPAAPAGTKGVADSLRAAAATTTDSSDEEEVPCEVVQVLYAQPYSNTANPPPLHPVSLLRNSLHHFADNVKRRYWRHHQQQQHRSSRAEVAAAPAASGVASAPEVGPAVQPGRWQRFGFPGPVLRLPQRLLPKGLSLAAADGATGAGGAAASAAAAVRCSAAGDGTEVPAAAATPARLLLRVSLPRTVARGLLDGTLPARLAVSARSDFHAVSAVPVVVQRSRVAILGTSPYAASLVQAALAAPAALAAAEVQDRAAAAALVGAGGAGALQAWLPPPLAWMLAAVRGGAPAAAGTQESVSAPAQQPSSALGSPLKFQSVAASTAPQGLRPQMAVTGAEPEAGTERARMPRRPAQASTATGFSAPPDPDTRSPTSAGAPAGRPGWKVGLIRLRWTVRQSLAAAAVGAAAATAAGATGAIAAVGAAAGIATALVAVTASGAADGSTSLFINAGVTLAAVLAAAAAATASALAGGEAAALAATAAAAAVAAAVAMTAASTTSAAAAAATGGPLPSVPSASTAAAAAAAVVAKARPLFPGLPFPLSLKAPRLAGQQQQQQRAPTLRAARAVAAAAARLAPALAPARAVATTEGGHAGATDVAAAAVTAGMAPTGPRPAAAPSAPAPAAVINTGPAVPRARWVLRPFVGAATGGPAAAPATPGAGSRGGGVATRGSSGGSSGRSGGRGGWMTLWWQRQGTARAGGAGKGAGAVRSPSAPPLQARDLVQAPAGPDVRRGWRPWQAANRLPTTAAPPLSAAAFLGSSVHREQPSPQLPLAARPSSSWTFPRPLSADGALLGAAKSTPGPHVRPLAQLGSHLLAGLRQGSGRAALPLPPTILVDGLEVCNFMVEPRPVSPSGPVVGAAAAPGPAAALAVVAAAAAAAAGELLHPHRRRAVAEFHDGMDDVRSVGGGEGSGISATRYWGGRPGAGGPAASAVSSFAPVPAEQLARGWAWAAAGAGASGSTGSPCGGISPAGAVAGTPALQRISGGVAGGQGFAIPAAAAGGSSHGPSLVAALGALPALSAVLAAVTAAAAAPSDGFTGCGGGAAARGPPLSGVSPLAAVRRMSEGLRRQVLQRGWWWRWLLGGVVGAVLRPAALVGFLGRLPAWGLQVVLRTNRPQLAGCPAPSTAPGAAATGHPAASAPEATANPDGRPPASAGAQSAGSSTVAAGPGLGSTGAWAALVVVASCRDPLRVLRARDMQALRHQAASAGCSLVPVLLTCADSAPGRRAAALRTLAAACGVDEGAVQVVWVGTGLLNRPAATIVQADLADVWRGTAGSEGSEELRRAVQDAVLLGAARREEYGGQTDAQTQLWVPGCLGALAIGASLPR